MADNNQNAAKMTEFVFDIDRVENVRKVDNAGYQHFLPSIKLAKTQFIQGQKSLIRVKMVTFLQCLNILSIKSSGLESFKLICV